ncbi:hypothetical protein DM790_17165 [Flavobacterium collinsii]|nr:hypothetical protein [Flavobacterium collinsii]
MRQHTQVQNGQHASAGWKVPEGLFKAAFAPRAGPAPLSHGMLERATMIRASMMQMNFTD